MVIDSLFQKRSQNLLIYLPMYPTSLPPQNETANSSPDLKPPSLPKMKLPVVHQFETFPISGQGDILVQDDVHPPPPGMKKLDFRSR